MEFVIAQANDWMGVYLNGVLVTQDHSISANSLLYAMSGYATQGRISISTKAIDEAWLETQGFLPDHLNKVKFAA